METLAIQASLLFPCAHKSSSMKKRRPNGAVSQSLNAKFSSVTVKRLPRRTLLHFIGFNSMLLHVNPVFAAPMPEMREPEVIRTLKLASGVRIQEIIQGEGPEASEGDVVELNYVCRRSNGYFVHSTVDQFSGESAPVILPLDENEIIKGLKEVLIGMKVGVFPACFEQYLDRMPSNSASDLLLAMSSSSSRTAFFFPFQCLFQNGDLPDLYSQKTESGVAGRVPAKTLRRSSQ